MKCVTTTFAVHKARNLVAVNQPIMRRYLAYLLELDKLTVDQSYGCITRTERGYKIMK